MSGLAWFMLFVGSVVCGDSLMKLINVCFDPDAKWWAPPVMVLCTAGQVMIFSYLVWVSL